MARKTVSSKELIRNFGTFSDLALREVIVITKNGRDRLVLMSAEKFEELQKRSMKHSGEDQQAN